MTIYFIKHKLLIEKMTEQFCKVFINFIKINDFYKKNITIQTIYNLKIQKAKYEEQLNDPLNALDSKTKEILVSKIFKLESAILDVDASLMIFTEF